MPATSRTPRADAIWIRRCRAASHALTDCRFADPAAIVGYFGAVQAQDYPGASWALGQRSAMMSQAEVDAALASGAILRTHVLRPTWHFVTPEDIRAWLQLTGPRIVSGCAAVLRSLQLDPPTVSRAFRVLSRALAGGPLTRKELGGALERRGIPTSTLRLAFVVMLAELDGLVASGPRRGREFTYALLDGRAPARARESREDVRNRLALRYFASHGPATVRDFTWWAGLPASDARAAIADLGAALTRTDVDGVDHWHTPELSDPPRLSPAVWLLPNFDEYVVAYRDRGPTRADDGGDGILRRSGAFPHPLVVDGRVAGSWGRKPGRNADVLLTSTVRPLGPALARRVGRAAARYSQFLGTPLELRAGGVS